MIPASEYAARRAHLASLMQEESLALFFAGVEKKCSADEGYPFEVNRNFYYLTGIQQEASALLIYKGEGTYKEYLFISPFDPVKEKWYGRRLTVDEAGKASSVHNVLLINALEARLENFLGEGAEYRCRYLYLDLDQEQKIAEGTFIEDYEKTLKNIYPNVVINDSFPFLASLRFVKSEAEVAEFKEAVAHTYLGIKSVMALCHPGMREFELANEFESVVNNDSEDAGLSFNTIMASGANATVLHYPHPLGTVGKGELVLMDLGCRHGLYCADVSRTIPADGKFTPIQKTVYKIVLGANKAVAEYAKPGLSLLDLQNFTKEYLASECVLAGLIQTKEQITDIYYHSVSHHIGLDTHDPVAEKKTPLVPGNIISDEPGLYIKELGIGVRIEDDLLITENGCEVLTSSIIKEVEDIEAFYRHRR